MKEIESHKRAADWAAIHDPKGHKTEGEARREVREFIESCKADANYTIVKTYSGFVPVVITLETPQPLELVGQRTILTVEDYKERGEKIMVTIPTKTGKLDINKKADLNKLSMAELVAAYNRLVSKKVKKFKDKPTAVHRLWGEIKETKPTGKVTPKKAAKPKKAKADKKMNFPVAKPIKKHREGTHRAVIIGLLSRKSGATVAECEKATGWNMAATREGIRILHSRLGYGLKEDDAGHIRLVK